MPPGAGALKAHHGTNRGAPDARPQRRRRVVPPSARKRAKPWGLRPCVAALTLAVAGCGGLRQGVFQKAGVRYAIEAPDAATWRCLRVGENDLAWMARDTGEVLAVNATCTEHGDPSLEVLTTHLLFGFTQPSLIERRTEALDGREALRSHYHATLDGVPMDLELLVLKKNGCVHDFTLVAPRSATHAGRGANFEALVQSFHQLEVHP